MIDSGEMFLEDMDIGRDDIIDMDEVSCLWAVSVNSGWRTLLDTSLKYADHPSLTSDALSGAIDIGIAEYSWYETICPGIELYKHLIC